MAKQPQPDDQGATASWRKIWDVFHDALDHPVDERDDFVTGACERNDKLRSQVRKLLAAHDSVGDEDFLDTPAILAGVDTPGDQFELKAGDQLGAYRLIDLIGAGGMGVVYRAQQNEPVKREVAIKFLQTDMATREVMARFEAERQALAIMSHSNIAKVYDAGTTQSGQPYFVMEYVAGAPVTQFCNEQQLGITERLRLFQRICDGVLHAHQKGVIHRDIKPSNILIALENGQPIPKIIDFGIAKATEQRLSEETLYTQMGAMIGTPDYMSPEQAGVVLLDVDTRADVYSLGVLLYELLFGVLPLESLTSKRGIFEVQEAIRDEEPQRPSVRLSRISKLEFEKLSRDRTTSPSALRKLVDGDISWVALKAMEKDRARRYSSVAELLSDVDRYLEGLPVEARAPTPLYRASKFARRHKIGVTLTVAGALLVVVFAGFMTLQTLRLQDALAETTLQRDRAKQVSDFMVQLFESANPEVANGEAITARGMLDRGAAQLRTELGDQPQLRASLLATIGESYRVLGGADNAQEAINLIEQALVDLQSLSPQPPADTAALHNQLGTVHHDSGQYDLAEQHYTKAIELFRETPEESVSGLADALGNLSALHADRGDLSAAADLARESVKLQKLAHGERSSVVARSTQQLGYILHRQGESKQALPMMLNALKLLKENYGDIHAYVANSLNYAAIVQRATGDARGAQASLREAVDIYRVTHGDDHPYLANTLSNLALAYNQTNDFQLAIDALDEAMRIGIANFGIDHPNVNSFRINIGTNLQDMGRYSEAEPYLRKGLERDREDLSAGSKYLFATIDRLGTLLNQLGQQEAAEQLLQEAVDLRREYLGESHADTGLAKSILAANLLAQGKRDAAKTAGRNAVDILRQAAPDSKSLADSIVRYARIMLADNDFDLAGTLLGEASNIYGAPTDDTALSVANLRTRLAELAEATGDLTAASEYYASAGTLIRDLLGPDHPDLASIQLASGRVDCQAGNVAEGLRKIRDARPLLERSLGHDNWQLGTVDTAQAECLAAASEKL
jgi:serine/threonine protein kinase/lipopolysaccharide biosynthesis regulator YciM